MKENDQPVNPKDEAKAKGEAKAKAEGKGKGEARPKGEAKPKGEGKGKADEAKEPKAPKVKVTPRLYTKYVSEVRPALQEKRQYKNVHQIPRMEKIVVNMGVSASLEKGAIDDAARDLAQITGRKPAISKSRHNIANFKLREGQPIGCRVTLRREVMYEFFDRLVATALPRIRDFRGVSSRAFDGRGNYTLGVPDQTIFPEIEVDKIKRSQGMDITIVTSAPTNEEAFELLKAMGMPFAEVGKTAKTAKS